MYKTKFIQCVMYILGDPHKKLQCLRATSARTKKKRFRTTTRNFQTFVRFAYLVFSGGDFKKKKEEKTNNNGSWNAHRILNSPLWAHIGAYKFQSSTPNTQWKITNVLAHF